MSESHSTSVRPYLFVFGALLILTSVTVTLSYLHLPHGTAVILAGLIALVKCCLIAAFFMHLRFENKGIYALVFGALFFVLVLVLAIIPDIGIAH